MDKILHGKQNVYIVFVICTSKFQRYIHLQQSALSIETDLCKHGLNPIFHIVIGEADSHPLSANEIEFQTKMNCNFVIWVFKTNYVNFSFLHMHMTLLSGHSRSILDSSV